MHGKYSTDTYFSLIMNSRFEITSTGFAIISGRLKTSLRTNGRMVFTSKTGLKENRATKRLSAKTYVADIIEIVLLSLTFIRLYRPRFLSQSATLR